MHACYIFRYIVQSCIVHIFSKTLDTFQITEMLWNVWEVIAKVDFSIWPIEYL